MNMTFKRQLFNPQEVKEMYPATSQGIDAKKKNDRNIKEAFSGKSDKTDPGNWSLFG